MEGWIKFLGKHIYSYSIQHVKQLPKQPPGTTEGIFIVYCVINPSLGKHFFIFRPKTV